MPKCRVYLSKRRKRTNRSKKIRALKRSKVLSMRTKQCTSTALLETDSRSIPDSLLLDEAATGSLQNNTPEDESTLVETDRLSSSPSIPARVSSQPEKENILSEDRNISALPATDIHIQPRVRESDSSEACKPSCRSYCSDDDVEPAFLPLSGSTPSRLSAAKHVESNIEAAAEENDTNLQDRYIRWAAFAQNPKVTSVRNTHAYLCALHFASDQFRDDARDKLIYRAIPTIPASFYEDHDDSCAQPPLEVVVSSSEDDDVQPLVEVLYPDISLEYSSENSDLVEPSGGGTSSQDFYLDGLVQNINTATEASSISGACSNIGMETELDLVGRKSFESVTPRRKTQSNFQSKRNSQRVIKNGHKMCIKNQKNLNGSNNNWDLLAHQLADSMPAASAEFLAMQLLQGKKERRMRKWTAAEKMLAMVVYKRWPECYSLLTNTFVLPGKKILLKMLAKVTLLPGLNHHMFKSLTETVEGMDAIDRTCLLLFDAIPIRDRVEYDSKTDSISGFQNLGDIGDGSDSPEIGNSALVFVVKGIAKNWKQPIAFYFTRGTPGTKALVKLLFRVLRACRRAGLNVVATLCKLCSSNTQMLKCMGASVNKPYFYFEKQRVVTLYDVPHLLRVLRNVLLKHDILVKHDFTGEKVESKSSWSIIRATYDIDRQEPPTHRRLPKLTDDHIAPTGQVALDVAVAAQVLSYTMASTIIDQVNDGLLVSSALATAHLVGFCDKLFDSLNGTTSELQGADGLRCQLQKGREDIHLDFWDESVEELKQWKVEVSSSVQGSECVKYYPLPCEIGWIMMLQGMKLLWCALKKLGFSYIEPGSFNLDTVEFLFKSIRSSCAPSEKPTVTQFVSGLKSSLLDSLAFVDVGQVSCAEETDVDDQPSCLQGAITCCSSTMHQEHVSKETASDSCDSAAYFCLSCVACSIARRLLLDSDCDNCERALCAATRDPNLHCGIVFKEYTETEDGLTYPCAELVECVSSAADVAGQLLPQIAHRGKVQATTLQEMKRTVSCEWLQRACPEHAESVCSDILTFVCRVVIQQWCRNKNWELSNVV